MLITFLLLFQHSAASSASRTKCSVYKDAELNGDVADCTRRGLTSVPSDLPSSIVALYLAHNYISALDNDTFSSYVNLTILHLAGNKISVFNEDAFTGLAKLLVLDLQTNPFHLDMATFGDTIFQPLKQLRTLYLNDTDTTHEDVFPSRAFPSLVNLETLVLDVWPGPGSRKLFTELEHLKRLEIAGLKRCNLIRMDERTFPYPMKLTYLGINCLIFSVTNETFVSLPNLSSLSFHAEYDSVLTIQNVTSSLHPFSGQNMSVLDMTSLQNIRTWQIDYILNRKTLSSVMNICLEKLIVPYNKLKFLSTDFMRPGSRLLQCLEHLDLSHNPIQGDVAALFFFNRMSNLRYLDLSDTLSPYTSVPEPGIQEIIMKVAFPPHLEELRVARSPLRLDMEKAIIELTNCSRLAVIDINDIDDCTLKRFNSFPSLRYFDISYCKVYESLFTSDFVPVVEEAYLRHVDFNFDISESKLFYNMTNLRVLDLSSTKLAHLNEDLFLKLPNLNTLNFSTNNIELFPGSLLKLNSLKTLDLSFNNIKTIDASSRASLDSLNEGSKLRLILDGNLFACMCYNLDFIVWLQETGASLDRNGNYTCITSDGKVVSTEYYYRTYIEQWRGCIGTRLLFWTLGLVFLCICSILLCLLVLKYYRNLEQYILGVLGYAWQWRPKKEDFEHDLYICYDDKDYQWPCHELRTRLLEKERHLRLYLPDLHAPFGEGKADVIIQALQDSWKVLIVISEDFLSDEWSYFTVISAIRLFSNNNAVTNRILLVFRNATPSAKASVPPSLLNVLSDRNILDFEETDHFWETLYSAVKRGDVEDFD